MHCFFSYPSMNLIIRRDLYAELTLNASPHAHCQNLQEILCSRFEVCRSCWGQPKIYLSYLLLLWSNRDWSPLSSSHSKKEQLIMKHSPSLFGMSKVSLGVTSQYDQEPKFKMHKWKEKKHAYLITLST